MCSIFLDDNIQDTSPLESLFRELQMRIHWTANQFQNHLQHFLSLNRFHHRSIPKFKK